MQIYTLEYEFYVSSVHSLSHLSIVFADQSETRKLKLSTEC